MATAQARGAAAEYRAARHLEKQGLKIIERNFRVRGGEIDLVCRDGITVVFVEVRLRSRRDFGGAGASITAAKRARLLLAARHWLARHGEMPCRFDCILMDGDGMQWLKNAISEN
jgi:putative endonuclease